MYVNFGPSLQEITRAQLETVSWLVGWLVGQLVSQFGPSKQKEKEHFPQYAVGHFTFSFISTAFHNFTADGPVDASTSKVCRPAILLLRNSKKLKGKAFLNSQLSFLRKESWIKCKFCLPPFVAPTQYSCQYVQYCFLSDCTVATDVKSIRKEPQQKKKLCNLSSRSHFQARSQKFQNATVRFAGTVRSSVRIKRPGSHWTDFHGI